MTSGRRIHKKTRYAPPTGVGEDSGRGKNKTKKTRYDSIPHLSFLWLRQKKHSSRLILFDLTFSLVPGPLFLLASVAFKVSALVSLC
jgi:hypothetical protein